MTDENDLMIINKSGITIRLRVADVRIMGRATQGVRLIDLGKRNDSIGSVCKVNSDTEADASVVADDQPSDMPDDGGEADVTSAGRQEETQGNV